MAAAVGAVEAVEYPCFVDIGNACAMVGDGDNAAVLAIGDVQPGQRCAQVVGDVAGNTAGLSGQAAGVRRCLASRLRRRRR